MTSVLLRLLLIGAQAGALVLVILFIRRVCRRQSKRFRMILWAIVALRLMVPVMIESPVGFGLNAAVSSDHSEREPHERQVVEIEAEIPVIPGTVGREANAAFRIRTFEIPAFASAIAFSVWLGGALAMVFYFVRKHIQIRKQVAGARRKSENVYLVEKGTGSFTLGVFRPRIYLESGLEPSEERYVLEHERSHIRYGDHLMKPFAFLLLSIYWFHPLLWVAYRCFCRDIELTCDERIASGLSHIERAGYASAMLNSGAGKIPDFLGNSFSRGEKKMRIESVLNYKKPAFWVAIAAVVLTVAAGILLFTVPLGNRRLIDRPYEYPVLPGTEEWASRDVAELYQEVKVPDGLAERMTTPALLETVLTYPFIVSIYASSYTISFAERVADFRKEFLPLDVLLRRKDVGEALENYINSHKEENQETSAERFQLLLALDFEQYVKEAEQ